MIFSKASIRSSVLMALTMITIIPAFNVAQASDKDSLKTQVSLGAGVAYLPKFSGADTYETRVMPIINIRYGRLSIGGVNGIAYELANVEDFRISATAGYFRGRKESDAVYLDGTGTIESSATMGVSVNKKIGPWRFSTNISRDFSDQVSGVTASISAGYSYKLSPQVLLNLGASLRWMNNNYANGVYGITDSQAATSVLPEFKAQSGFESGSLSLTGLYFINKHWTLTSLISQSQLLSDAKSSPITREENPYFVMTGVSYRF
jgi:outer membrane scaffolding protein for murein synthesis (MipA/OmpV family)